MNESLEETDTFGLCDECAKIEILQASACVAREKLAKKAGQFFTCTCPEVRCGHGSLVLPDETPNRSNGQ